MTEPHKDARMSELKISCPCGVHTTRGMLAMEKQNGRQPCPQCGSMDIWAMEDLFRELDLIP